MSKITLGEKAYEALKKKVATMESGAHLSVRSFAKEIGIGYTPVREAFLRMVKIVEYANRTRKISLNHLAMGILTAFEYNYRLSTAGDYIRQMVISAEQGMQFLGLIEIDEWG